MYGQYLTCYSLALGMLVTVVGLVGCSQPKDAATQSAAGDRANDSGVQEPAGKVLNVKSSRPLCEVPFILTEANNISVAATLNKADEVNLMFHTANSGVVLTEEASQKASSIKFDKLADMKSWGGSSRGRISDNNALAIGPMSWVKLRIFQDRLSGTGTDGKFGPDLFKDQIIEIDFDSRKLRVFNELPQKVTGLQKLKVHKENGMMFLTGIVKVGDATLENKFLVHSGFGGGVLLDDAFVQANRIGQLKTISESELRDSGGNVLKTKKVELPAFKLGGFEFAKVPAQIFDGSIRKQKMSIIGGDLLKRFNLIVDQQEGVIYVEKNNLFDAEFKK